MNSAIKLWNATPAQLWSSAPGRWGTFVVVLVLVCMLHGTYLFGERQAVLDVESDRLRKHTQIIEHTLSKRLEKTADVLHGIGADLLALHKETIDRTELNRRLHTTVAAMYGVRTLMVANANGQVVSSSDERLLGLNLAQEKQYGVVDTPGKYERLLLSRPYKNTDGGYAIAASQSFWNDRGTFIGYVVAEIEPGQISSLLETAIYGYDMRAMLIHANGLVMFATPDHEAMTGRILGHSPHSLFAQHRDSGNVENVLHGMSMSMGFDRVAAYRTAFVQMVPPRERVIVTLGRKTHALLAPWRTRALRSFGVLSSMACMALGFMLILERRRKMAQRLLEEHEHILLESKTKIEAERKRLDRVIHAADIGVHEYDVPTGVMRVNDRWADMLGYSRQELLPITLQTWELLMHEDDMTAFLALQQTLLDGTQSFVECVVRMRDKGQSWKWVQIRTGVTDQDEHGKPVHLSGVTIDITKTHEAEVALQKAYQYARSLLEASLDPLVTISVDGKITDVNQATVSITGIERSALVGTDFCSYFTEPEKARNGYRLVFSQGHVSDYPLVMKGVSGNTVDVLYNASLYHDEEGHITGVFAAARDVSLLRKSQHVLERINHDVLLLAEMSNLLQSCTSVDESFPIIVTTMKKLFPASTGRCFMMKASGDQMIEMEGWGMALPSVPTISPCDCWALRLGHAHEYGLVESINPPCRHIGTEPAPYMCVPLVAQGQSLGVIHLLLATQDIDQNSLQRIRNLVKAAADSIGLSLANLRLRESLHAMSVRDPLTGLYNRRFMEDSLAREISRMARNDKSLAVAMLDLDHFKQFNDQFGHDVGDLVLKEFARLMQGFREGSDVACRFGGEEFLLVLPDLSLAQAQMRLNALREAVSKLVIRYAGRPLPTITVSIGFAMFPEHGKNLEDLTKQADRALYCAKGGGRNRVVSVEETTVPDPASAPAKSADIAGIDANAGNTSTHLSPATNG